MSRHLQSRAVSATPTCAVRGAAGDRRSPRHPEWTLTINGHTDGVGDARANQALSERRGAAVRAALVDRFGARRAG